ncbi:DNA-binding protein [Rhizobacter sp. P5_C2]
MKKETKVLKTFQEARGDFRSRGITIANWAKENDFEIKLVYAVLAGERKCYRGESHRIAVALGIKEDL